MKKIFYVALLGLLCLACDDLLLGDAPENTAEQNFKSLWEEFDRKYGMFPLKGIDWDSVYNSNIERAKSVQSEKELYDLLVDILAPFQDSHVALVPVGSGLPVYQGGTYGSLDTMNDFSLEVIRNNYLQQAHFTGDFFTYGWLTDEVGYIHIEGFSDLARWFEAPMDELLEYFEEAEGLIIDVRGGYGGEDVAGQYIAGRFTDQKRPYMITKVRNGPGRTEFTEPVTWFVKPEGKTQFLRPVVVLTHRFTISARETFCLAMKVLPNVTFVGDTTAGAFSNQINRELPNGWGYSLSIGDWRDADGISHEGIGLVPDILVKNRREDLLSGVDEVIERAVQQF